MTGPGITDQIALLGDPVKIAEAMAARDRAPMERLARAAEIVIAARSPQVKTHQGEAQ